jgi:hypothetical protein
MVRGSCLCGGVAFELEGELTPIQNCHAQRCRKASGAAFAPEMLGESSGLRWLHGEELISHYEAPLLDKPPPYRRAFCSVCGSPVPTLMEGTPFVSLLAGVLDDDPGTRPWAHAFVAQQAVWYESGDELPQFDERPPRPKRYEIE